MNEEERREQVAGDKEKGDWGLLIADLGLLIAN